VRVVFAAVARARLAKATVGELDVLVLHRRRMWQDIGGRTVRQLDAADPVYRKWLRGRLKRGKCAAFVVDEGGEAVASGVLWIQEAQPRPGWRGTRQGYLLSMYTEPGSRGRGHATRIVRAAVRWARAQGVDRVTLHASPQGRRVYASAGFERTWEMRRLLRKGPTSMNRRR
jgi:GNAT superfamily N-acetyltransferase